MSESSEPTDSDLDILRIERSLRTALRQPVPSHVPTSQREIEIHSAITMAGEGGTRSDEGSFQNEIHHGTPHADTPHINRSAEDDMNTHLPADHPDSSDSPHHGGDDFSHDPAHTHDVPEDPGDPSAHW